MSSVVSFDHVCPLVATWSVSSLLRSRHQRRIVAFQLHLLIWLMGRVFWLLQSPTSQCAKALDLCRPAEVFEHHLLPSFHHPLWRCARRTTQWHEMLQHPPTSTSLPVMKTKRTAPAAKQRGAPAHRCGSEWRSIFGGRGADPARKGRTTGQRRGVASFSS